MYKTVRHGENSLQYKILAQQEEGIPNSKRRKLTRGKTAGVITIVLLLVCGVIATAVLVPLVLTNDFITLTGTFQKFSVSTLRRSHSGNHVVVIAKKPHGWNSSRQSVFSPPSKLANASSYHEQHNRIKETTIPTEATTFVDLVPKPNASFTKTLLPERILTVTIPSRKTTEESTTITITTTASTTPARLPQTSSNVRTDSKMSSPMIVPTQNHRNEGASFDSIGNLGVSSSSASVVSTPRPSWYENQRWNLEKPTSLIDWSKSPLSSNSLPTAVGGICAVAIIVIMIIVLVKSLPDRQRSLGKESAESKEDKTRLLKPSARTSDEE